MARIPSLQGFRYFVLGEVPLEHGRSRVQASPEPLGWSKSSPKVEIFLAPFSSASPTQPQ